MEYCSICYRPLVSSIFDTVYRIAPEEEVLLFGLPGDLCVPCRELFVDKSLLDILGLPTGGKWVFVIESDTRIQFEATERNNE